MPGDGREFHTSSASAQYLRDALATLGALVSGRTLFDLAHGWSGRHPAGAPVVVVTHEPPADWAYPDAPFTFVTDGVAAAIAQAKAIAAGKNVAVASADIARQCVELGLLDVIAVDLVPVLLGAGKPWFGGLGDVAELADPDIIAGQGVTHLIYRVVH
jgi:dihydrofolate reductase